MVEIKLGTKFDTLYKYVSVLLLVASLFSMAHAASAMVEKPFRDVVIVALAPAEQRAAGPP